MMEKMESGLEDRCINTLRFLAVDAIEKANSGHPGMPLGAAAMAFVLWHDFLRFDPAEPKWHGRDRFVLSAGHASGLLYALLHCAGVGLPLDELRRFRQWDSLTPGHPEHGLTPGVEMTTGPLGQGFATGVGMALAARLLSARLDGSSDLFEHRVFGLVSDGDMMEGISHEAASLAAHWGLGNLIYLYDSNDITIEGDLSLAMSEDVGERFRAYGWHVQEINGLDPNQVRRAVAAASEEQDRPSLVVSRTKIGFGSPKEGKSSCHGSPLGPEAVTATRKKLGWPQDVEFHVPDDVKEVWHAWAARNGELRREWEARFEAWQRDGSKGGEAWRALTREELPADLLEQLVEAAGHDKAATRVLSGRVIQRAAQLITSMIGGSADLHPSNKTLINGEDSVSSGPSGFSGRNIHFGIREHAMAAVCNGLALHGPWRPYCGTFLVFTDYMRPSMRLAAMMGLPVTYVMTHDSFFVGEDGPTHQPVEHLWAARMIPGLRVMRPADGVEVAAAWAFALESRDAPTVLALSRQGVPPLERPAGFELKQVKRGGYVVSPESGKSPDLTIVATGSEVSLALDAKTLLVDGGLDVRVVSMPCVELFEKEDPDYRAEVIPAGPPVVAIEAGISGPWRGVLGRDALVLGLDDFGASAPPAVLCEKFGFTAEHAVRRIKSWYATAKA